MNKMILASLALTASLSQLAFANEDDVNMNVGLNTHTFFRVCPTFAGLYGLCSDTDFTFYSILLAPSRP
jgi:hypothetical protein